MLVLLSLLACITPHKVDQIVVERVIDRGVTVDDVDMVCELGASLRHVIAAATSKEKPAHQSLVIAETAAALCVEPDAWEAELDVIRALSRGDTAEAKDARIRAARAHTDAARRFHRAWGHVEPAFGVEIGTECPKLHEEDELVWALGLFSGVVGLLHDRKGGGEVGVPMDTLARVSRAASCLDDEGWWSLPSALESSAGAVIPGGGPEGVDPWVQLETAAQASDESGVRLARALAVLLAANAGDEERVSAWLSAHAAAEERVPTHPDWGLFDAYAHAISLHEADLIWTREEGHRAPGLKLPGVGEAPPTEDLFGENDPFGE